MAAPVCMPKPANKKRGYVEIEIGGEVRTLKFDFNALAMLEERLGQPFSELWGSNSVSIRAIREALYVGLLHEDKRLSVQRVGSLMEPGKLEYYAQKIIEAMGSALGVDTSGDEQGEEETAETEG